MNSRVARDAGAGLEARAQRAQQLSSASKSAGELFGFVAGLLRAQASAVRTLESLHAKEPLSGQWSVDGPRVIQPLLEVPRRAAERAPPPLADEALVRVKEDPALALERLRIAWNRDPGTDYDYLSRAMLRPWLETLRANGVTPERDHLRGHCPFCGGSASVGCRRQAEAGEGAQSRFLVCSSCGLEWSTNRILCPACFETDPHKLPSFSASSHPAARVEACETCRRYLKVLDLTVDARILPEVDDMTSLALDLWAAEQGFTRLKPGLGGV
ncbi:MAG TPA: formate dehydrogenase accessory protein FdhE [Planctomycetota bacterium]|nr:formate dehydrogenase accessory protein FdhE [Planctomycetota bacterium]